MKRDSRYLALSIINGDPLDVDVTDQTNDVLEAVVFVEDVDRDWVVSEALEAYAESRRAEEAIQIVVQLRQYRRQVLADGESR